MRGVSKGLLGGVAVVWVLVMTVGVFAQTAAPAGPAEVPAEAKKMKAAVPSSPAAIEAGKVLFAKYCRFCHGNTGAGDSTMAPKNMKPSNLTDAEWTRGSIGRRALLDHPERRSAQVRDEAPQGQDHRRRHLESRPLRS